MSGTVVFRGLKGRTLDDQMLAVEAGYTSILEYAIDELGQMVVDLIQRVEALEERRPLQGVSTRDVPGSWA